MSRFYHYGMQLLEEMTNAEMERQRLARRVYDVLMQEAGATQFMRSNFLLMWDSTPEYRFQGLLGFGGKFRRNRECMYVDCYPEDMTPGRAAIIEQTNRALDALQDA